VSDTQVAVIGAGILGLAIARELKQRGYEAIILERAVTYGMGTSSRNSEVIHAGLYYPANTLKSRFCIRGNQLLYDYLSKNELPFHRCGKLILAPEAKYVLQLEKLLNHIHENGLHNVRLVSGSEAQKIQPGVNAIMAIFSPDSGILSAHELMHHLHAEAQTSATLFSYEQKIERITYKREGYYEIHSATGESITATYVINAAGLYADAIAASAGLDIDALAYRLQWVKGSYFRLRHAATYGIQKLLYPLPNTNLGGLGIHLTPDLNGGIRIGPDVEVLQEKVEDYAVDPHQAAAFRAAASELFPALADADIHADSSGIRPKRFDIGGKWQDFVIQREDKRDLPGFINLIGIESPGLTAALAIAEHVGDLLAQ
jgi:L-2-hydroxyglutarate oxidase LhgO